MVQTKETQEVKMKRQIKVSTYKKTNGTVVHTHTKSLTNKKDLDHAYQLGVNAFNTGKKSIPHLDMELNRFFKEHNFSTKERIAIYTQWNKGWHTTNLKPNSNFVPSSPQNMTNEVVGLWKRDFDIETIGIKTGLSEKEVADILEKQKLM
jgi:hypothetical protein